MFSMSDFLGTKPKVFEFSVEPSVFPSVSLSGDLVLPPRQVVSVSDLKRIVADVLDASMPSFSGRIPPVQVGVTNPTDEKIITRASAHFGLGLRGEAVSSRFWISSLEALRLTWSDDSSMLPDAFQVQRLPGSQHAFHVTIPPPSSFLPFRNALLSFDALPFPLIRDVTRQFLQHLRQSPYSFFLSFVNREEKQLLVQEVLGLWVGLLARIHHGDLDAERISLYEDFCEIVSMLLDSPSLFLDYEQPMRERFCALLREKLDASSFPEGLFHYISCIRSRFAEEPESRMLSSLSAQGVQAVHVLGKILANRLLSASKERGMGVLYDLGEKAQEAVLFFLEKEDISSAETCFRCLVLYCSQADCLVSFAKTPLLLTEYCRFCSRVIDHLLRGSGLEGEKAILIGRLSQTIVLLFNQEGVAQGPILYVARRVYPQMQEVFQRLRERDVSPEEFASFHDAFRKIAEIASFSLERQDEAERKGLL